MKIEVYTDGSATVKTKPGGWGYVLVVDGQKHSEACGHIEFASNNDAELEAAIHGLAAALKHISATVIKENKTIESEVILISDSQITLNWANGSYRFKQEAKMHRFNILKQLMQRLNAKTRWVQGHAGDEHNERCDKLANEGRVGPKPPKPPKKPKVQNRLFRWNEVTNKYEDKMSDKERLAFFMSAESGSVQHHLGLEVLSRIVIELMELEEARKK